MKFLQEQQTERETFQFASSTQLKNLFNFIEFVLKHIQQDLRTYVGKTQLNFVVLTEENNIFA